MLVNNARLFMTGLLPDSRTRVRIATGGDIESQHHRVIFVDHVMAMHGIAAEPVSKPHLDRYVAARNQSHGILPRKIHARLSAAVASRPAVLTAPTTIVVVIITARSVQSRSPLGHLVLLHMH